MAEEQFTATESSTRPPHALAAQLISQERQDDLARHITAALHHTASDRLNSSHELIVALVQVRRTGRLVGSGVAGGEVAHAVYRAVEQLADRIEPEDVLSITLATAPHRLEIQGRQWQRFTAQIRRGLAAYRFEIRDNSALCRFVDPIELIATNRRVEKVLASFCSEHGVDEDEFRTKTIVSEYATQQFQYFVDSKVLTPLYRSSELVNEFHPEVDLDNLLALLTGYLQRSVQPDGRMRYLYYPSRSSEDRTRNNSIRQWMATLALSRVARQSQAPDDLLLFHRNLQYNLDSFFEFDGPFGIVTEGVKVKLGAIALAALSIIESPKRGPYQQQLDGLLATMTHLWCESGEFRTFYRPSFRNDQQNFYPGEALLTWAHLFAETRDETLRQRFFRSFEYYREWHRQKRNPAFIPWHTQACYLMWQQTGDDRLCDFIFEMNDWLLPVQQLDNSPTLDTRGRFFDPDRPFGPPHASSTGVYLEGLADALALAVTMSDSRRMETYRTAIRLGLRSLQQLTFKDDLDMFFVSNRNQLRGGVRTTVYNNIVRVDNVQHNLLALHKISERRSFERDDL